MAPSNPEIILRRLDEELTVRVELTLIGRAALVLGYDPPVLGWDSGVTYDVDVVIPLDEEAALDRNEPFWVALERTNHLLRNSELFLSHIFLENQVIIGEGWRDRRVPMLLSGVDNLVLFRPASIDLLLTKMARADDPADRADILQLIERERFSLETIEAAFGSARCPDEADLREQFEKSKSFVRRLFADRVRQNNRR
ncbi:MAG: hypothetical protein JO170_20160 [Verrucomicrobia bacterium]|nr:hypothetical protein [Verrucomicrobiota bacterium]